MTASDGPNSVEAAAAEVPGTQIRPAKSNAAPPRASATPGGACVRPFINDQLNSRLPKDLAGGTWKVRWQADLSPEFPMSFVLTAGNRIVVQGSGRWQLFDTDGKSIKLGKLGAGDVVMDSPNGLFYIIDPFGVIEAHRLTDGELEYSVSISGGEEWHRLFYTRRGHELAIVSYQREIQPHSAVTPTAVTIDVQDLGNPIQVEEQIVVSAKQKSRLYYTVPRASAASIGDTLVAAIRNEILVTEFGARVRARLVGTFEAGMLSLDEAGRVYLLARPSANQSSLWVLTAQGERVAAFDFPMDVQLRPIPPVVGYNHRTYFTTADTILCLSPEGTLLWRKPALASIAGIAATPSDKVLVTAGSSIALFDAEGQRRVLHSIEGDVFKTPPAMTQDGDLLVASAKRLYSLTSK